MSDYGLSHILKYKWKTKIKSFNPKFWKEDNSVALSKCTFYQTTQMPMKTFTSLYCHA